MKQIRKRLTYGERDVVSRRLPDPRRRHRLRRDQEGRANEIKAKLDQDRKIVKEAVTSGKLKKNAVTESKIADAR